VIVEDTMTDCWHRIAEALLYVRKEEATIASGGYTNLYHNVLVARSMQLDCDMGRDSWFTPSRWTKLQRDYLIVEEVVPFVERCAEVALRKGRTGMNTQMFFKAKERAPGNHVWGNCLMAMTWSGGRWAAPTVTLHSRVSFVPYLGGLDLALALVLTRQIADASDLNVEDIALRWYLDSASWTALKSVPYVMAFGHYDNVMNEKRYPDRVYPAIQGTRTFIKRFQEYPPEHFKFGQTNRMSKRWQLIQSGDPFPSIHSDDLTLLPEMLGQEPTRKRRIRT